MFKIALLASAMLVAASTAAIGSVDTPAAPVAANEQPCHPGQPLDTACALRTPEIEANGTVSAAELANLAAPANVPPLPAAPDSGPAFQDIASEAASVLPAPLEHSSPKPLVPALFALGAMIVLLRKRPN